MKKIIHLIALFVVSCASSNQSLISKNNNLNNNQFTIQIPDEEKPIIPVHNKPKLKKDEHWVPVINFNEIVDENSVNSTIKQLEQVTKDGAEAIIITINSPGGSVGDGIKLAYVIENSTVPVHCLVDQGFAASMGSYLFESCTTRSMTKRGVLMFHQISLSMMGEVRENDVNNIHEMLVNLDKAMAEHCVLKSKVSKDYFLSKVDKGAEWWVGWEEAAQDGLADQIVPSLQAMEKSLTKDLKLPKSN